MHDPKDFHRPEEIDKETRAIVLARVYREILSWLDPAEIKAITQPYQEGEPGDLVGPETPAEAAPVQDSPAQGQSSQSSDLRREV
jgi:hypothetical protein